MVMWKVIQNAEDDDRQNLIRKVNDLSLWLKWAKDTCTCMYILCQLNFYEKYALSIRGPHAYMTLRCKWIKIKLMQLFEKTMDNGKQNFWVDYLTLSNINTKKIMF